MLETVYRWRVTCDAPDCTVSREVDEGWDEHRAVQYWEVFGGIAGGAYEWAEAYCEGHKDLAPEYL